jgi:hypothetical protein
MFRNTFWNSERNINFSITKTKQLIFTEIVLVAYDIYVENTLNYVEKCSVFLRVTTIGKCSTYWAQNDH